MRRPPVASIPWRPAVHVATGAVWLHQGLWCKVLGRDPEHHAVLAGVPGPVGRHARAVGVVLGMAETALALVVMRCGGRRDVAAVQTGAIVAFNAGGLVLSGSQIEHPVRLIARNAALVGAIWCAVDRRPR